MNNSFIFDDISNFINGFARVCIDNKYGIIDTKGRWVFKPEFENILPLQKNYFIAKQDKKFGIIDKNSNILVPYKYDYLWKFHKSGYLSAKLQDKYGVLDSEYNVVIPFEYEYVSEWSSELFAVVKNGKWGCVNYNNEIVIPFEYDKLYIYKDYIILGKYQCILKDYEIENEIVYGVKDFNNNVLIPFEYKEIRPFDDDLSLKDNTTFSVKTKNDKFIILNSNNEKICNTEFDDIITASSNLYSVKIERKYGVIDRFGNIKIPFGKFYTIYRFDIFDKNELLGCAENEDFYCGLINQNGEIVIPFEAKYKDWVYTYNKLIIMYKNEKYGVIDRENNIVIPFIYDYLLLRNDYNIAMIGEKWGYIDNNGRPLHIQPIDFEPENKDQLKLFREDLEL